MYLPMKALANVAGFTLLLITSLSTFADSGSPTAGSKATDHYEKKDIATETQHNNKHHEHSNKHTLEDAHVHGEHDEKPHTTAKLDSASDKHNHEEPEQHSDSTSISDEMLNLNNIQTSVAQSESINTQKTLFGLVTVPQDKIFRIYASYESLVKEVYVVEGQIVKKGQLLLKLFNKQNLQTYNILSPDSGEITKRFVNIGDHADENILLEIIDLSDVWIELSAFPKDIEILSKGQGVWVYDLHQHLKSKGKIIYVAPIMTEGHIARVRAQLNNKQGHWRPGMHIKADINVSNSTVDLAVKNSALQSLEGQSVVFVKHGNEFTARPVKLGKSDQLHTEILSGLLKGDEYVSVNSFIIKADIKKDGASHDH